MRPRFTSAARDDVDEAVEYLADRSLDAAIRFYAAIESTAEKLSLSPGLGRPRDFGKGTPPLLRSWLVDDFERYVLFYRPIPGGIEVLRVLHGSRNLVAIFRRG